MSGNELSRDIRSLIEVSNNHKVKTLITGYSTESRHVVIMIEGDLKEIITITGALLYNLYKQLSESKRIPKMNYFKFVLWFYKQSITQAKDHVKNIQAKSEASKASVKSGTNIKPS